MTFHFIQVLLLVGLINAGILFLTFQRLPIRNKLPVIYLGSLLLLITLFFVSFGILPRLRRSLDWFHLIRIPVGFFIGPIFLLWVKSIYRESTNFTDKALFYFIPGIIEVLLVACIWIYIEVTQPLNRVELLYHPGFSLVYNGALIVYTSVYLVLANRVYTKVGNPLNTSSIYRSVFYVTSGLILLWLTFYVIEILQYPRPLCGKYYSPLCLIPISLYLLIGYHIMIDPKKMNWAKDKKGNQFEENNLIYTYYQIREIIIQQKLYLNPEFTVADLSPLVKVPAYLVPKAIRLGGEQSLSELLNKLRIETFLQKMDQGKHKTLTFYSMARESGFKSRATFYRAFKKYTGQTPSSYIANK